MFIWKLILPALLIAACQPAQQRPFAATIPPSQNALTGAQSSSPVPTAHPLASRTSTLPPSATFTPTLTPTITLTPTRTLTPTITLTTPPIASPTPTDPTSDPNNTPPATWTPPPADPGTQIDDHYHLSRPIDDGGTNWVDRTYPYGGTSGGNLQVHHGVDLANPRGTPVLSAGDGEVVYAGNDDATLFGPQSRYYGNLVVIRHSFSSGDGQPVFTLYGHLDRVDVETGSRVTQGTQIGLVGGTGVAFGAHLHFEVRAGDPNSFDATLNPELWIFPFRNFGTLAGRVTDASGNMLYEATVQVQSMTMTRYAFTYADQSVNPDPVFGENFALGDLPAGYYEVSVNDNGRVRFQEIVYVYPNRTTWVDVELRP
jgi:murein DD-endopeptidase MepM/ murein hydrolase activator NlpD